MTNTHLFIMCAVVMLHAVFTSSSLEGRLLAATFSTIFGGVALMIQWAL